MPDHQHQYERRNGYQNREANTHSDPFYGKACKDNLEAGRSRISTRLFREPKNAERNRLRGDDHVHEQPLNQVMKMIRAPGVKRGERQNDQIHYFFKVPGATTGGWWLGLNSSTSGRSHPELAKDPARS
jgi:hypothetical protein